MGGPREDGKRPQEIRADLVVGADSRRSVVRQQAGLTVENLGAPIDVLWMRLSKRTDDPGHAFGYVENGHVLVMFDRGDYWQCAFVIPKGGFVDIKRRGLEVFRADIGSIVPSIGGRVGELRDWSDIKLLAVLVDRLRRWRRPGLLCRSESSGPALSGQGPQQLPFAPKLLRWVPMLRRIPARLVGIGANIAAGLRGME